MNRVYKSHDGWSSNSCSRFFFYSELFVASSLFLTLKNRMETLLFLFPQFNYLAQKEEAYFKMLVPEDSEAAKMKDDSSGLVDSRLI